MILESDFKPAFWLCNPHAQTIFASKMRNVPLPNTKRERLLLPDGDFVDLDFTTDQSQAQPDKPLICLFHGLEGSIDSSYMRATMNALVKSGYACVLMHFRGCSGEPNRRIQSYHSGHTDDIRYLFSVLQQRHPHVTLAACGFSLGANALLKYQGEEADNSPLTFALAISPPFVLASGARRMSSGFSRVYQRYLISLLKASTRRRMAAIENFPLMECELGKLNDFWQFDGRVTAKLNGFKDVHDYYEKSSCRQYLHLIKSRTHIIHARDDPFFEQEMIPKGKELSPYVTLELAQSGGHVGFVSSNNVGLPRYWLDSRITDLMDQHFS